MTDTSWLARLHRRFGWVALLICVIAWLVVLAIIAGNGFERDCLGKQIVSDHIAFYVPARMILEGRGAEIYDFAALGQYQCDITNTSILDAFRNPPFYAILYMPTAELPYLLSFWIWSGIGLLAMALAVYILAPKRFWPYFLWGLTFYPVTQLFSYGQNSLLSLFLFAVTFALLERRRLILAGMAAGLLLYKPQLLLGLGVWWMLDLRSYWRCVLGGAMTAMILILICLIFLPVESEQYIENFRKLATYEDFSYIPNQSPRAFVALLLKTDKEMGNWIGLPLCAIAVGAFIWFTRRCGRDVAACFSMAVFLTLWAAPHALIYEWSIAVVPAVILWDRVPEYRPLWRVLYLISWVTLLVSMPLTNLTMDHFPRAVQISIPIMAVVGWIGGQALMTRASLNGQPRSNRLN